VNELIDDHSRILIPYIYIAHIQLARKFSVKILHENSAINSTAPASASPSAVHPHCIANIPTQRGRNHDRS
jgi:hypothetical protein